MNILRHTLLGLTLLTASMTTCTSCDNDDVAGSHLFFQGNGQQSTNPFAGAPAQATSLVGVWEHLDNDGDKDYYQFNADGTGYEWEIDRYASQGYTPYKKPFQYVVQGQTIVFREADGDIDSDYYRFIDANTLVIDGDRYIRVGQAPDSKPQPTPQTKQTTVEEAARHIVGTWQHPDGDDTDYMQFNADGTGYEWDVPAYAPQGYTPYKKPFSYEVQQGRIIFTEYDGELDIDSFSILIDGRIMLDNNIYSRLN